MNYAPTLWFYANNPNYHPPSTPMLTTNHIHDNDKRILLPAPTPAPRVTDDDPMRTTMNPLSLIPAPSAMDHDHTETATTTNYAGAPLPCAITMSDEPKPMPTSTKSMNTPTLTVAPMIKAAITPVNIQVKSTWGLLAREAAGTPGGEDEAKTRRTWQDASVTCVCR